MENLAKVTVAETTSIGLGSIILDDGCGTGAGTAAIIDTVGIDTAFRLLITAVDINEDALDLYKQKAAQYKWPAEAIKGDAGKLDTIADSTFTHAIGTALLFVLPEDGIPTIKEIYRTLKPSGITALNS
jgi:ubiquinone/menaquinone biosynthesis C-methylase UbiE